MPDTTSTITADDTKVKGDARGLRLGRGVTYRDSQGFEKAALVVGTRKSIREDGQAQRPEKGTAHLLILSVTGNRYVRHSVPEGEGPNTFTR
jgi:hypothetical protein